MTSGNGYPSQGAGDDGSLLVTVSGALTILGRRTLGRNAMYELVRSGRVPAVKIGRKYVLARATVQALANDIAAGRLPGDASQ